MNGTPSHEEILDLLANKKITLDEAMQMLSGASSAPAAAAAEPTVEQIKVEAAEPVYKPEAAAAPVAPVAPAAPVSNVANNGANKANWLQIRVRDLDSGRSRVTVNLPLAMAKFGLNIARRFGAESDDIDLNQLAAGLSDAEPGILVDVQDEDSNEHVQISLA